MKQTVKDRAERETETIALAETYPAAVLDTLATRTQFVSV